MTYPGDPSLAPDIQNRVITTFDQTEKLAAEGRLQEALLGCDFILRLDPLFEPAKRLHQRLGAASDPAPDADAPEATTAEEASPEVLKTVRLSSEDLQRLLAESDAENEPPAAIDHGPLAEAELPVDEPVEDPGDDQDEATSFLAGVRRAIDSGEVETARRLLDMAASLDPDRPEVLELRAEFDRITAPPAEEGSPDRIAQLLTDGQRAFDDERYQDAIDCWSRIFLIEIDHDEASRRIQLARDLREEQDRQVEETFHQGVAAAEAGNKEQAASAFRRVLELRPNHMAAREHLDGLGLELTAREAPATPPAAAAAAPSEAGAAPGVVPKDLQVAPTATPRHADASYRMAARAKAKPVNPFFLIGAAVLVLMAGGAWLLLNNWDRLFPNATEETAPPPAGRIKQATATHDGGDLEGAIAALEEIGSDSHEYLQARRLLARWREELAANATPVETLSGDDAAQQAALIRSARESYDRGSYLEAARSFARASAMAPLAAAEAALFEDAKRQLEPIAQQIDLYTQRQWELVLPALWRRFEQAPQDRDVHDLLVNSYFNLTLRELRRGEIANASRYVKEVASIDADDTGMQRLRQFVATYGERPRDLLYEIYVSNLDFRH